MRGGSGECDESDQPLLVNDVIDATKKTSYQDVIISSIGEFGLSQFIIVLGCKLPMITAAWSMIMMSFAGADNDWWSVVTVTNTTDNTSHVVKYYQRCIANATVEFDTTKYTIISEWHLICSRKWIPSMISTSQMVGVLLGAAVVGQLGDSIGRKKSVLFVYTMDIVLTFVQAFAVNWQMLITCVFFVGFSLGGFLVIIHLFLLEFVGTKWRTLVSLVPFWGIGVMLFGIMFKVLPNWRHLCLATGAIGTPIILLIAFLPESVRWLFGNGKFKEGKQVLRQLAKRNGMPEPDLSLLDEIMREQMKEEKLIKRYTYFTLLREESTRKKIPLFAFMWFYMAFGYYGLTLGVSKLAGDISLNMVLFGLGEMFCLVLVWLISKCFGRKYTTLLLMAFTGLTSFAVTIAYFTASLSDFEIYMNVFAIVSRFVLSAAWASLILFTVESFPTVVRSLAYGLASVFGRVGSVAGTQQSSLSSISVHLPFTVNGGLGIVCAAMCLLLNDTYDAPLEDHIEQNESSRK